MTWNHWHSTQSLSAHMLVWWYNILITNSRSSNIWIRSLSDFAKLHLYLIRKEFILTWIVLNIKERICKLVVMFLLFWGTRCVCVDCRRLYDESITSLSIFGTKCLNPAKLFTINLIRAGDCSSLVHVECGPETGTRCHETFQNHQKNLNISPIFRNILIGDCI